jgi:hypothetical protein
MKLSEKSGRLRMEDSMQNKILVFESKSIRRIWYDEELYFSVVDVVGVLTESKDDLTARKFWNKLS